MKRKDYGCEHYIQTFKGGSVVRVLNRDTHGDPVLRFKKLKTVCKSEDMEKHRSKNGQHKGRKAVETELKGHDYNIEGFVIKSNSNKDDDTFDSMTLKELKERRKKNKRKRSVDSTKQLMEPDCSNSISGSIREATAQLKEDAVLDEPLSLKLKLSTKPRTKRKTIAKATSTSYNSWISVDASTKDIRCRGSSCLLNNVSHKCTDPEGSSLLETGGKNLEEITNVETSRPEYMDSPNTVHFADSSTSDSSLSMIYRGEHFSGMPEDSNGGLLKLRELGVLCEETSSCLLNEVSDECMEPEEPSLLTSTSENFEGSENDETLKNDNMDSQDVIQFAYSSNSGLFVNSSYRGEYFDEADESDEIILKLGKSYLSCEDGSSCQHEVSDEFIDLEELSHLASSTKNSKEIETSRPDYMDAQDVHNLADNSTSGFSLERSYDEEDIGKMLGGSNGSVLKLAESPSSFIETSSSLINEVSNRCIEAAEASISASTTGNMEELSEVGVPEIRQSIPSCVSQHLSGANLIHSVLCYFPTEATVVTNSLPSEKRPSVEQDRSSCHVNDSLTQMPDIALNNSSQCKVSSHRSDRSAPDIDDDGGNKEDDPAPKPVVIEIQTFATTLQTVDLINNGQSDDVNHTSSDTEPNSTNSASSPCFSPSNVSSFMDDDPLTAEPKHTSLVISDSLFAHVTSEGLPDIHPFDATKSLKDVDTIEGCSNVMTENPPKNLLSSRKVISPNSQERLCRDLGAGDLPDKETLKCREKLVFEEQTVRKNPLLKTCAEGVDVSMIRGQHVKKLLNNKSASPRLVPRGILKLSTSSNAKLTSATECASEDICVQKAIKFSQRQMQDIESHTLKLMKELVTMKDIVKDIVCSEECQTQPSKYTADQIKSTIGNVVAAEGTTKKWLTMMSRDCTRFCKIMESSNLKSSLTSGNEVHKKKKKIKFADEYGGSLCDVRVYKPPQYRPEILGLPGNKL
ncbi:hypothetical protein ACHQM5_017062 [Ranunculus cassubicifolius]